MYEAELMQIYDQVFANLGIPVRIVINHRKILEGIAKEAGCEDQFMTMTLELDKLDKIGKDGVLNSFLQIGINETKANWILDIINESEIDKFNFNDLAQLGVKELQTVFDFNQGYAFRNEMKFDASLARGLSYYTGCIFEVLPTSLKMGSLGGGGRYDNLTGVFGLPGVSGVGISFGADRIYDVMEELNLFPENLNHSVQALFINLDAKSLAWSFQLATQLRQQGIAVEVYPEISKIKKQFAYAENLSIPYVMIIGEDERKAGKVNIKNQKTGEQQSVMAADIAQYIC